MNENRELLVENIRTWLQLDTELKNIAFIFYKPLIFF